MTSPPNELLDERSDPHVRGVLEDWAIERGFVVVRLGVAIQIYDAYPTDADDCDAHGVADAEAEVADTDAHVAANTADVDDETDGDDANTDDATDVAYCDAIYAGEDNAWADVRAWSQILCGEHE